MTRIYYNMPDDWDKNHVVCGLRDTGTFVIFSGIIYLSSEHTNKNM